MKRLFFGFIFLISSFSLLAQCSIDYSYYPVSANYGLSPDSLPNGYVGQYYDQDMTFYLPLDTFDSGLNVISWELGILPGTNSPSPMLHFKEIDISDISQNSMVELKKPSKFDEILSKIKLGV